MTKQNFTDSISEQSLRLALGELSRGLSVCLFDELDSTNTEAKRQAVAGVKNALVVARCQNAGRGRMGRSFYSPPESGVYFSLLLSVEKGLESSVFLTSAASVAVMRAIRELTGKQTEIKWVNDLFWQGKKVCGILCESMSMGDRSSVIIGIGINLKSRDFPPELSQIAGSLGADSLSQAELIAAVCRELRSFLKDSRESSWLEDYRRHSLVLGKPVEWHEAEKSFVGVAEAILEDGALLVRDEAGEAVSLRTGEISLRLLQQ